MGPGPGIIIGFIVVGIISGFFCKWLANVKGYSKKTWFWLGFFFGIISIIIIAGAPDLNLYGKIIDLKSNILSLKGNSNGNRKITKKYYKLDSEIVIYEEPDVKSKIICRLLVGEEIEVINEINNDNVIWCKIKDGHNNNGWCELMQIE